MHRSDIKIYLLISRIETSNNPRQARQTSNIVAEKACRRAATA
jgi:hypothetical protein